MMELLYLSKFYYMKRFLSLLLIMALSIFSFKGFAQNDQQPNPQQQDPQQDQQQLGLPGDNLNLYAVMKLFQESPTLEEFEKKLNDETLKVNNLDLDGDNKIDYIKVIDNVDGSTHNIALKVAVNQTQDQDVAVFVVKKDRDGQVQIQLIGDEALYGKNYIIEPNTGSSTPTPNPGYTGDQPPPPVEGQADYAVSSWPMINYMFVPTYSPWSSPWHYGYYPTYWQPWTPFFWHEYYGYQYHWNYYYRANYRATTVYRFPGWHQRYYGGGFRSSSAIVQVRFNGGNYRQTYSRPDLANRGSDLFRRDHPNAPSVNRPLPRFDNNNNGRPIITRRDGNRPGDTRPGGGNNTPNRPGYGNNNRPITRPADGNNNRPVTRPADGNSRPNRPGDAGRPATRPANGNNFPNRPATNNPSAPRPQQVRPQPQQQSRPQQQPRPQPQIRPAGGNNRPVERPARKD